MEGIREISNEKITLKELQKRLEKIFEKSSYKVELGKTKNQETSLKYELRFFSKTTNYCLSIKCFFDKIDILYYVQGLEDIKHLS